MKRRKKRYRRFKLLLTIILLFASIVIITYVFVLKPKLYVPGYEIYIPKNYIIHGIDVSHHQSNIDWQAVSEMESKGIRIQFVFIKATEGGNWQDRNFTKNWAALKKFDFTRGAYHYFKPRTPVTQQVKNFMNTAKLSKGDLPPVLDVEETGGLSAGKLRKNVTAWLEEIERRTAITPIIYTSPSFYKRYFSVGYDKYPVWVAHYYKAQQPRFIRDWVFWQHSKKGKVNGIIGDVDFNVFYGSEVQFKELLIP